VPVSGTNSLRWDDQTIQIARIERGDLTAVLGDEDRVGWPESGHARHIEPRLDAEDHPGLDLSIVTQAAEGLLVTLEANAVTGMVPHHLLDTEIIERLDHVRLNLGAGAARTEHSLMRAQ
jgi:hypothetical protein